MFVDNDDYIDKDYIDTFVTKAIKKDYDIVIGGYRRTNEKGEILLKRMPPNNPWGKYISITPWARIYKKSYLIENDIQFLDSNIGEDFYFNLQAITISENIGILDYIGYNWFYNTKSVSNTIQKQFYNLEVFKLLEQSYQVINKKGILQKTEEIEYIQLLYFLFFVWLFGYTGKSLTYQQFKKEYHKVFSWLEEKFPNFKNNHSLGFAKPKGELLKNRIQLTVLMKLHKCHLGMISLFCYTRLVAKI